MPDRIATFSALKELPTSVAIIDSSRRIVAANKAWNEFSLQNELRAPRSVVGADYLQCWQLDDTPRRELAQNLTALLRGDLPLLTFVFPRRSEAERPSFLLIGIPISAARPTGAALIHVNIAELLPPLMSDQPKPSERQITDSIGLAFNGVMLGSAGEAATAEVLSAQLASMFGGPGESPPRRRLTGRQIQILTLLGKGKSNKEIANTLTRSPNTVKIHVSEILKRLNLKSRTEAALLFAYTRERAIPE